ncbi:hypothetical protein BSZ39_11910 [Bowdeniella nasicola]|uniref:LytR/CpsA/Psr regulator C-terminal domain-containing protein n=1 Tax=Bowdeniella nasicola TaxID=208480 RepID=A0A1Q5PZM5_9ACTO|nr:LytR C-terminal domain-containing protein [Bowdeniella nasicola]OKL52987.1 hypothetical protein BSZ39_11910 [Bowdeniella nasicola]
MTHYEEDEFDIAARERGPVGVHRRLEPRWRTYLPYAIVIVLAPLLAWAAMSFLGSNRTPQTTHVPGVSATHSESPGAEETPEESGEPSQEPSGEPTESPSDEPSEEPSESPSSEAPGKADKTQLVTVLNGSGIKGLAARVTQALKNDGFTKVVAENYRSNSPAADTIYYRSAKQKASAEAIGKKLGITNLVESARSTESIAVVLRTNVLR